MNQPLFVYVFLIALLFGAFASFAILWFKKPEFPFSTFLEKPFFIYRLENMYEVVPKKLAKPIYYSGILSYLIGFIAILLAIATHG